MIAAAGLQQLEVPMHGGRAIGLRPCMICFMICALDAKQVAY